MRTIESIIVFVAGGVVSAAIAGIAAFYLMFGILRLVAAVLHDDAYLQIMWIGVFVEPVAMAGGFGGGGYLATAVALRHLRRSPRRGFEVIKKGPLQVNVKGTERKP